MSLEIWVILGLAVLFGGYGAWAGLRMPDSWDRKPASMAGEQDAWDFHKATLGIYQEPGAEPWQQDLAALHFERKHPYC